VTNLFNHTLPLIRYELSDQVRLLEGTCPCGSQLALVADVEGRADDVLWYGGLPVHPHVLRSALGRHRAVVEHRVEQTTTGCDVAVLAGGTVDVSSRPTRRPATSARCSNASGRPRPRPTSSSSTTAAPMEPPSSLTDDLRHALAAAGVAEPEVTVRVVNELPRTIAGKLQRYVPLQS